MGMLMMGRKIRGMSHFVKRYHITVRELETMQHVLSGSSEREIGRHLGITKRTVKAHIKINTP